MAQGSADLQIAIYNLLNGLTPKLGEGVFAPATQNQKLPYVEIGESDTVSADLQCRDGVEETVTIHVWANPGDQVAAKRLMERVSAALHGVTLIVEGRDTAFASVRGTRLFHDVDEESLHGVITVRVNHFGQMEG